MLLSKRYVKQVQATYIILRVVAPLKKQVKFNVTPVDKIDLNL